MKSGLITIGFLLVLINCSSQEIVVNPHAQNVAYARLNNRVFVVVQGTACGKVNLKSTNGSFQRVDDSGGSCEFTYRPERAEATLIEVFERSKNKLVKIGSTSIEVRKEPVPEGLIGISRGGDISRKALLTQGGVRARLGESPLICLPNFTVTAYRVILLRNKQAIATENNAGARYAENVIKAISAVEKADQLIFTNIKAKGPNGKVYDIGDMIFTIVE